MTDEAPSTLVPKLVLYGLAAFVALSVLGWIVGAVIGLLRVVVVLAVIGGIVWAVSRAGGD